VFRWVSFLTARNTGKPLEIPHHPRNNLFTIRENSHQPLDQHHQPVIPEPLSLSEEKKRRKENSLSWGLLSLKE